MGRLIAYRNDEGTLCIIHPTGDLSDEETARKDVPAGVPYVFVEPDEVPTDRSFREAWTLNFNHPDGHGIGPEAWFAEREAKDDQNHH